MSGEPISTYALLVIFGVVSGVFGPVDYDRRECVERTQTFNKELSSGQTFMHGRKKLVYPDVFFSCVDSEDRPVLGTNYNDYR